MGQARKISKAEVQIKRMKNMLTKYLETGIAVMEFNLTLMSAEQDIKITKKVIKMGKTAIEIVQSVKHIDILTDFYNSFIVNNMAFFVAGIKVLSNTKKIKHWDTEKGYKDFLKEREIALAKCDKELEEKKKEEEMIKKAKAKGKNVELMYKDGKIKHVIVEEKPN